MKLGIVTDCVHYKTPDGRIGTENHVLVRQFEALCAYFPETLMCCATAKYDSNKVLSFYSNKTIKFSMYPAAGGQTLESKLKLISLIPTWWKQFKVIDSYSDIVYQRFPNNLNIPGFFYFWLKRKKVFGTYTGTWHGHESFSYRTQKIWLRNCFKGPLWVYTQHPENNGKIRAGFSPSYTQAEWDGETSQVEERLKRIEKEGIKCLKLLTVGSLIYYRNQDIMVKACALLKQRRVPFTLTIVGDGEMRKKVEGVIESCGLQEEVKLVGKKKNGELREMFRQHDFVLQSPSYEGYGKVPVEAMFHGVVPVIYNLNMAPYMTGKNSERGFLFDSIDASVIADALEDVLNKADRLPQMIRNGRAFVQHHTLEAWAADYYNTIREYYAEA